MIISEEANRLISKGLGYRTESFTDREKESRNFEKILKFEVKELGNTHILADIYEILKMFDYANKVREYKADVKSFESNFLDKLFDRATKKVKDTYGADSTMLWLGDRDCVLNKYGDKSTLKVFKIPERAVLISDLGAEGQLFLAPGGCQFEVIDKIRI